MEQLDIHRKTVKLDLNLTVCIQIRSNHTMYASIYMSFLNNKGIEMKRLVVGKSEGYRKG